jgi:hypothetical protein
MEVTEQDENDILSSSSSNNYCPLFMDGLPRDFSTNPALAALASLLDDDNTNEDINDNKSANISLRNRKEDDRFAVKRRSENRKFKSFHRRKGILKACEQSSDKEAAAAPSPTLHDNDNIQNETSRSATIGEASLFLKMWKL